MNLASPALLPNIHNKAIEHRWLKVLLGKKKIIRRRMELREIQVALVS